MRTRKLLQQVVGAGFAASLLASHPTAAADDITAALAVLPDAVVLSRTEDGMPTFLVGDLVKLGEAASNDLAATELAMAAQLTPLLAPFRLTPGDVRLRKIRVGPNGQRHYRYRQIAGGFEVIGGDLVVHVDSKGSVYAVNGSARGDLPRDGTRDIGAAAALQHVVRDPLFGALATGSARLVYLIGPGGRRHRAYELVVEGQRGADPVRDKVYVDAASGNVLAVHPQIHFAENRRGHSANNGTSLPGTLRRWEGSVPSTDTDVELAFANTGAFYEAHAAFWGRDSYDNLGATLISSVHYSTNYCNAFWNGTQIVFGDGNASSGCMPLVASVDLTAHELTHAVTEHESNLIYAGESGAINESMSDIFGAFVEAWVDGGKTGALAASADTWHYAEDVFSPALRYLDDPAADGVSADFYSSLIGNLDIHYSSGVSNLAFYLLSQGGTHPRGKSTVTVRGIGMEKAIRIFYEANVAFLTSNADYQVLRHASVQAAQALGYDQATQESVTCAFAAVGIGQCRSAPPQAEGVLRSGLPIIDLADGTVGGLRYWSIEVPAGQATLSVQLAGGKGDADLYVRAESKPTPTAYGCRPRLSGNAETCVVSTPTAGTYWIGLRTRAAYAGVSLVATYAAASGIRH
jgi:vibriolysin